MNPKDYHLYSGGAQGSDLYWGEVAEEYGIGSITHFRPEDYTNAEFFLKEEAKSAVQMACKALGRPFKPDSTYFPLLGRNYFQVINSDGIFAVGRIIAPGEKGARDFVNKTNKEVVDGGTGYAVEMGIQLGNIIYVFDMDSEHGWYHWDYQAAEFNPLIIKDIILPHVPRLDKHFAGIGSRELTEEGKQAIRNVFKKTFGK